MSLMLELGNGGLNNNGKEFVLTFMDSLRYNYDLELFIATSEETEVNVNVTAPKWPLANLDQSFTIRSGEVKQLFISNSLRNIGTAISGKGIYVSADNNIVVYGVNKEDYSNDAFLGLPTDVLGNRHFTVSYSPAFRKCEVVIAAVEDDTSIRIKLPVSDPAVSVNYQGLLYGNGGVINIVLDRFSTFQFQSVGDLTGSRIDSDKPVSVFSGNMKTNIGTGSTQDHLVEQIPPVEAWGKRFATVPTPYRTTGDYFRFIASEDDTVVNVTRHGTHSLANAGQYLQLLIPSNEFNLVSSNKAILVVMFVLSQLTQFDEEEADPSMILIPPIQQWASDYTFATPKFSLGSYENFFMLAIDSVETSGLMLNGRPMVPEGNWTSIPGTNLVGAFVSLPEGVHRVRHISPIVLFAGYLYGKALSETYGFPTGMRLAPINALCTATSSTDGDGVDNDCDGFIDEELCLPGDDDDDDMDGYLDEDCAKTIPVDGFWSDWGAWGDCSQDCGEGMQTRTRSCDAPAPAFDGQPCAGDNNDTQLCVISSPCYNSALGTFYRSLQDQAVSSLPEPPFASVPELFGNSDVISTTDRDTKYNTEMRTHVFETGESQSWAVAESGQSELMTSVGWDGYYPTSVSTQNTGSYRSERSFPSQTGIISSLSGDAYHDADILIHPETDRTIVGNVLQTVTVYSLSASHQSSLRSNGIESLDAYPSPNTMSRSVSSMKSPHDLRTDAFGELSLHTGDVRRNTHWEMSFGEVSFSGTSVTYFTYSDRYATTRLDGHSTVEVNELYPTPVAETLSNSFGVEETDILKPISSGLVDVSQSIAQITETPAAVISAESAHIVTSGPCTVSHGAEAPSPSSSLQAKSPVRRLLSSSCICPCSKITNLNKDELDEVTRRIGQRLALDKANLSATIRKHISVWDARSSSRTIGVVGVSLIIGVISGVILLDVGALFRDFKTLYRDVRTLCASKV
ncbi:uncharacterized protein [Haliotis cracherodii]|uniref:uncharacterized protein n=1 Tax=Haliotis cracherodii TaxID=6455 RepID=UPI0039EAFD10